MARDDYLEPYLAHARSRGTGFDVTLWANRRSQVRRFAAMRRMFRFSGQRILDVGCSRGDLARYLLRHDVPYAWYTGIDAVPEVIAHARRRRIARSEFHAGDVLANPAVLRVAQADVVVLSGTLNTMTERQAIATLTACWHAAGDAMLFNFLSDKCGTLAPPQLRPARRLSTMRLLDWALRQSSQVVFRQDYFPYGHDASVLIKRHQPRS